MDILNYIVYGLTSSDLNNNENKNLIKIGMLYFFILYLLYGSWVS